MKSAKGNLDTKRRRPHRGSADNIAEFAPKFVRGRLRGFEKDMCICLRDTLYSELPERVRNGRSPSTVVHAYFPALGACCATLEYLSALYAGHIDRIGESHIQRYAKKFLPQPDYSPELVRVLYLAFRHPVAHRGIASGVWKDAHPKMQGRRLTWNVSESDDGPPIRLAPEASALTKDSPWPCAYTHRVHINLGKLWRDIKDSADKYLLELATNGPLLIHFEKCMRQLYPV